MSEQTTRGIFIVDDDMDDREFIIQALQTAGFPGPLKGFINGARVLDHLYANLSEIPALLVLDLNMPVKDGFDTLRELKSQDTFRGIPVMVLTSSGRKADKDTCIALGCEYFHNKPMDFSSYKDLANFVIRYTGYLSNKM